MNLPMNMQKNDVGGIRHPASLGIIMSYKLGQELNIPAFFVNPMPTDELCDMARVTGIPGIYRPAKISSAESETGGNPSQ